MGSSISNICRKLAGAAVRMSVSPKDFKRDIASPQPHAELTATPHADLAAIPHMQADVTAYPKHKLAWPTQMNGVEVTPLPEWLHQTPDHGPVRHEELTVGDIKVHMSATPAPVPATMISRVRRGMNV
jgi:hypothetical protein